MSDTTFRIPQSVVEDTRAFRTEVEKFLSGESSAVAFRAIRVPMGIYEQRENDTYMVRVRGAAGVFLPHQVERVAELSQQFGNGIVHATTRQDLQIHRAKVEDTPTILERLLEVGLSSRGGGGNTVRNVSACPDAGACRDEVFDVTPYALALTEYLVQERANFNLPRKFKAAFSGCAKDCGLVSVADLGFYARERDGARGFAVYAGGGMGAHSALSVLVEEWIPAEAIFETAEAMKRLFDKEGDRTNRHKARLRYVVGRLSEEGFRARYREELEQVRAEGISVPVIQAGRTFSTSQAPAASDEPADASYLAWKQHNVVQEKTENSYSVTIALPLGDIRASDLSRLANLTSYGDGTLRTTQLQGLQIRGVPQGGLPDIHAALSAMDKRFVERPSIETVACAGASTCKLGLCLSRGLASAIESELEGIDAPFAEPIRISGCPNSCGHHPISPIGLYGSARRINERLVPVYGIVAGGRTGTGEARLAEQVGRVPAKNVPDLLRDFWTEAAKVRQDEETLNQLIDRWGFGYLKELVEKYQSVPPYEEAPEFYRDFGSCQDFSLAGRGPGECGAGVMDVVSLDIDAARKALKDGQLYEAVLSATRALLVTRGLEPKKDREVYAAFAEHLIDPGWVSRDVQSLIDAAIDFKLGDRDTLSDLQTEVEALLARVEQLYQSLDANLAFRVEHVHARALEEPESKDVSTELDLRGVACPMNFVRAKIGLEALETGEVLEILLDDGEPVRNVPASFAEQGQEVISVDAEGPHFRVKVRKRD